MTLSLLLQQLEDYHKARGSSDWPSDMSDQARRQIDRGEKFCGACNKYHKIDEFGTRVQGGKRYFESYCRKASNSIERVQGKARRSEARKAAGRPPYGLEGLATRARKRATALAAGKSIALPAKTKRGWATAPLELMFTIAPKTFDALDFAKVFSLASKQLAGRYITAMYEKGWLICDKRGRQELDIYHKKEGVAK